MRLNANHRLCCLILSCLLGLAATSESTVFSTDATILNDVTMNSLSVVGKPEDKNGYFFKTGKNICSLKINNGELEVAQNKKPFITVSENKIKTSKGTWFSKGVAIKNQMEIDGKRQWTLVYRMDHNDFDPSILYECGIYKLIGGYKKTSIDEMTKSFPLPEHKMVRIEGHFHFLDNWKGDTGYIKVGLAVTFRPP